MNVIGLHHRLGIVGDRFHKIAKNIRIMNESSVAKKQIKYTIKHANKIIRDLQKYIELIEKVRE